MCFSDCSVHKHRSCWSPWGYLYQFCAGCACLHGSNIPNLMHQVSRPWLLSFSWRVPLLFHFFLSLHCVSCMRGHNRGLGWKGFSLFFAIVQSYLHLFFRLVLMLHSVFLVSPVSIRVKFGVCNRAQRVVCLQCTGSLSSTVFCFNACAQLHCFTPVVLVSAADVREHSGLS